MTVFARDLPPQSSINAAADAYAETSLLRSSGIPRFADFPYGNDPAQRLDIYLPDHGLRTHTNLPVFLFWHGGGFTHGHKEWCGFMAPALLALPAIFISANYRLLPQVNSEELMDDARATVRWVLDNISRYGGNPNRLVIGGHSAGAVIAARLELDADHRRAAGIPDGTISGVIAMSGSYHKRIGDAHPDPDRRLPADQPDCAADFSGPTSARFTLAWGTLEREAVQQSGLDFANMLESRGINLRRQPFENADHFSVHLATGEPDNAYHLAVAEELMALPC
ncbi:hypothetical protein A6R70_10750 [Agrobacterium rubi]|nr:hypothetical protein [Agrobacterium rubi]OCJ51562.1 hypothetical protein A6U92_08195 [Agrobacterium rubi]